MEVNGGGGCVIQMLSADRHMYTRQWSGNPTKWSNWFRVGSPVPAVDGTIYMYLEKRMQIALRVYYIASHGKPIHVGYTWFKVFRLS